ncbi:MAG: TetR/AcrR family transcriptional regulator [Spirochaetales bacterium]
MDKKNTILDAAFEIWGKSNFTQMSLTPIAKHLGITKPALYKHFRSKEELLQGMERRFLAGYVALHQEFFRQGEQKDLNLVVRLFLEKVLGFYLNNPYYLSYFYVWLLHTRLIEKPELIAVFQEQRKIFKALLAPLGLAATDFELDSRLHFLYISTTFWVSTLFWKNCHPTDTVSWNAPPPKEEIEKALQRWHSYCLTGLLKGNVDAFTYETIENKVQLPPVPKREHDRIFQAIVDVSAEVGIRQASVDRIAEKLGMSKSSLYSHFRNKRSMFEALLREEQRFLLKVLKDQMPLLSGFVAQSYGFMYLTLMHNLHNPSLLSLFNWFRFQNIRMPVRPPSRSFMEEYFSFFYQARDRKELVCTEEDLLPAAVLLHVLSFRLLHDSGTQKPDTLTLIKKLRAMHRLYLHGLCTPIQEEEIV